MDKSKLNYVMDLEWGVELVEHALDCLVGFEIGIFGELVYFAYEREVLVVLGIAIYGVDCFTTAV